MARMRSRSRTLKVFIPSFAVLFIHLSSSSCQERVFFYIARRGNCNHPMEHQAWVTLATNDSYALGALVLAQSLKDVFTTRKLVILVTPGVTQPMRDHLSTLFDGVNEVNLLDSEDSSNLALLTRPDLGVTFTKIHCWRLTSFEKCVFLDADTLVLQNCDELFDREELSAAPDVGWPDCFNSGVFVFRPSEDTYRALVQCALNSGSFDGGDQGLLNVFFHDWASRDISKHLSFVYNMSSSAAYSYLPAFKRFGKDVKVVHFLGPVKPWNMDHANPGGSGHSADHVRIWWRVFLQHVHPLLQPDMCDREVKTASDYDDESAGVAGQLAQLSITPETMSQLDDRERRLAWERGSVDYLGTDSFDNIQRKLGDSMGQGPS